MSDLDRIDKILGERLHTYLKENGVKSTYLAEKLGMQKQSLNAVFKGKRKMSATEYLKACQVLKVDADYFNPYRIQ